ncbi:ATP-grasp domain-containing protein [Zooshikella ganghwensis]|uniref:ATP-grasp domain-containing protein n=1 Tax=Zooshikella ganghwensis TaxID=202772 RepID=A0A4P9VKE4_9GAMM|nr:ATP-grasp domain-containing protein [Zooshikella ganghwensis]RDH43768.1 ATP-grasp domain-containing protein [Zooshikella ganghwensis]
MKKRLILIETLHTGTGLEIIKSALTRNIEVYFITAEAYWFEPNVPESIKQAIHVSYVDWSKTTVREQFLKYCENGVKVALFTQRDGFVEAVADVCAEFNLNFQSAEAIQIGRNKQLARQHLANTNVSSPGYYHASTIAQLRKAGEKLSFPIISKPANGSGSKDITLLHNLVDLNALIARTQSEQVNLLLEEFIVGELISVESFTYKGMNHILGCTNRLMTHHPEFIELGYAFPYKLNDNLQAKVEHYTNTVLDKLNYTFGFCHIEFIVGEDDIYLIEVNPRLGGGQLGKLMSNSLQANVYDIMVDALFDDLINQVNFTTGDAYGCYTIYPTQAGTVKQIHGVEIAKHHPNIVGVISAVSQGDQVTPPTDMLGHAFQVIAKEKTAERALLTAYSAATSISLEVV